ncbi:PAAR domain-containing protein [Ralstonia solanacearum]|uniref:PAAR domain-containing protein n=1 Tax=Ralstonia solanacearum TaxID=305 RepID=A0A5H2PSV6_RALSL|nr:PAAR domain-containing protein [Ralstonia solanacearum]AYB62919.1 PAAR domain-containing protein [Ralstonia solanacearum]MBB6588607.1 PAAR domain-containing protein [Ralstonia solanacearum]MCG3574658.1 PAAR domain-containing protein [Ralstonia solanacearum]MCL9826147.1 PAAR domain-containing protein [Ralstonia solanacearum]MCL9830858.1 PAAR domain-containing protein [Ralstonia solanacearum]
MKLIGWIRHGDKAACGGTVAEGHATSVSHGRSLSYVGGRMACPRGCVIAEGHPSVSFYGKSLPHHGHRTSYGCPLLSTLNDVHGWGEGGENVPERFFLNADGEWVGAKEPALHEAPYDEQPHLIAPPIEGVPYYVVTMDGRTFSGRTAAHGLLPRIGTYGEDEYVVYWGDEVLAKMEERV